jgi:penicillin-insensitive murein endopeptidase
VPVPAATAAATPPGDVVADADTTDDSDTDAADEGPDDEDTYVDGSTTPQATAPAKVSNPLLALSEAEIQARFRKDPASLGPMSVGKPNAGALVNGVAMPTSTKWNVLEPGLAWGTQETVDGISKAIERVHTNFAGTQSIPIGHISSKHGGYLPVHKSHQAGRDVDLGYYFTTPQQYFVNGTKANLDLPRTLDLLKGFFASSDIEMIFIDTSIQKLLVDYAVAHGEDAGWLDRTFAIRQKQGVFAPIRHVRGHKNHIHVRFASPGAVALGRRVAGLVAIHPAPPPGTKGAPPAAAPNEKLVAHRARSGDTLVILAKRYGCTVEAIVRANGIKGTALKAGHVYQIPVPVPAGSHASPATAQKHPKKGKSGG